MSRQEEDFRKRAELFADETRETPEEKFQTRHDYLAGCEYGYQYALQRPGWISVKDELPKHDTEENGLVSFPIVLVCLYDGYRDTTYYDDMGEEWGDYDGEVEYWMPMPPAPGKED